MNLNEQFLHAAMTNDLTNIKRLLDNGADINTQNKYGRTALMIACIYFSIEIIHFLLEKGSDINLKNKFGNTALTAAYENDHTRIINILEEHIESQEKLKFIQGL